MQNQTFPPLDQLTELRKNVFTTMMALIATEGVMTVEKAHAVCELSDSFLANIRIDVELSAVVAKKAANVRSRPKAIEKLDDAAVISSTRTHTGGKKSVVKLPNGTTVTQHKMEE